VAVECTCVAALQAQLGEGALWDAARGLIWSVDIASATLHAHHVASGVNHAQQLECRLTALGLDANDGLIACGDCGFVRLAVDRDLNVKMCQVIASPAERAGNRFNDGKVDASGRFWAGTMDEAQRAPLGALYRFDSHGMHQVRTGMWVPNGPCFLADNTMLVTDTQLGVILALTLTEDGTPIRERLFAQFAPSQGYPDGMTVDAQGHIWVAFWDGWCVRRLSADGKVTAKIAMPVQRPTCPTFGGTELNTLFITSARTGLSADQLLEQPLAGGLFRINPGVRGHLPVRFMG
jgi:xylono-1,5-lactonase